LGKRAVVSVAEKACVHVKNNILVQASEILPSVSPSQGQTYPSIGTVLEIFSVVRGWGDK
jgi:hypothetical protein